MIDRSMVAYGSRDSLVRESYAAAPYSHFRREIEVNDGAMWRQAVRILRKHWKASLAFALLLELLVALLVFSMD
ncbi:MAG TPA: hypothetical protein VH161_02435, partial [Candidatus Acidoferrales bacterium]|nr:hypothetical protein [Candidatus Acidoferrales bacterium]